MARRGVHLTGGFIDLSTVSKPGRRQALDKKEDSGAAKRKKKNSSGKKKRRKKKQPKPDKDNVMRVKPPAKKHSPTIYRPVLDDKGRDWVCLYLKQRWIPYIDNRPSGGSLWVRQTPLANLAINELKKLGAYFIFSEKGEDITNYEPTWFLIEYPEQKGGISSSEHTIPKRSCRNCSNSGTAFCAHGGFRLCDEWREKKSVSDYWPQEQAAESVTRSKRSRGGTKSNPRASAMPRPAKPEKAKNAETAKPPHQAPLNDAQKDKRAATAQRTDQNAATDHAVRTEPLPLRSISKQEALRLEEGVIVHHQEYGFGEIITTQKEWIFIAFENDDDGITRRFPYPKAFTDGLLKL